MNDARVIFLMKHATKNKYRLLISPEPVPVTLLCKHVAQAEKNGFANLQYDVEVILVDPKEEKR